MVRNKILSGLVIASIVYTGCFPMMGQGIKRTVRYEAEAGYAKTAKPPGRMNISFEPPLPEKIISTSLFFDGVAVDIGDSKMPPIKELVIKNVPSGKHQLFLRNWDFQFKPTRKTVSLQSGGEVDVSLKPATNPAKNLIWLVDIFFAFGLLGAIAAQASASGS